MKIQASHAQPVPEYKRKVSGVNKDERVEKKSESAARWTKLWCDCWRGAKDTGTKHWELIFKITSVELQHS